MKNTDSTLFKFNNDTIQLLYKIYFIAETETKITVHTRIENEKVLNDRKTKTQNCNAINVHEKLFHIIKYIK